MATKSKKNPTRKTTKSFTNNSKLKPVKKPQKTTLKSTRKKSRQKPAKKLNLKSILIPLCSLLLIILAVCAFFIANNQKANLIVKDLPVIHETKFGGVYLEMTIDDFNDLGFEYGDSVDVKFSNGYELNDIPYYNGYYVDMGEPLLIAYPGYDYIKAAVNYGADLFITAGLTEEDTATINLNSREKYLKIQNSRDIHYAETQGDLEDVVFANFRNVTVGNLKTGILYRSASPVDNSHNRAPVVDRLMRDANVQFIVNLSDSADDLVTHINKDDFNSPYFLSLYQNQKVIPLDMTAQFEDGVFEAKLVQGLTAMANHSGPYLIHCVEGKDRTGYVLMIVEALAGASYQEIVDDYMYTYKNYYDITRESDRDRYDTIKEKNIDLMLHFVIGDEEEKEDLARITNYDQRVRSYLLSIGMNEDAINQLVQNLTK